MSAKSLFILVCLSLFVSIFTFGFVDINLQAPDPRNQTPQYFIVNKGESASTIAKSLKNSHLIKSPLLFKLIVRIKGLSQKLEAGEFKISPNLKLSRVIDILQNGALDVWITLPEGLRKEEIAIRLENELGINSSEFLNLTSNPKNLEGYLFPDTYLLPKNSSSSFIINKLTTTFAKKTNEVLKNRSNNLTEEETITIASLIEREVKTAPDRKIVSGIIIKRLQSGWPLNIDASLQYAKAASSCVTPRPSLNINTDCKWWQPIAKKDKEIKSSFNTYRYANLPPGPISNPGISSISAASNPVSSAYWYYLSDSTGETHFAQTLEEHNRNIDRFLK